MDKNISDEMFSFVFEMAFRDATLRSAFQNPYKDDVDEAKKTFDKIIEKDKSNYLALYNCGLILLNNNRIEEAKEYLNKSLEIQPDFDKGLITMGNIYAKENQFDEAINNFDKILKTDPKNEMCLLNKAYTNSFGFISFFIISV